MPLHLVLLKAVAGEAEALSFATSKDLFDAFWDRKRRACQQGRQPVPRFSEVVGAGGGDECPSTLSRTSFCAG